MITLKTKMRRMKKITADHDFSWVRDQCGGNDGDDNLNKKWQKIREIMFRMLMMMIRKR